MRIILSLSPRSLRSWSGRDHGAESRSRCLRASGWLCTALVFLKLGRDDRFDLKL